MAKYKQHMSRRLASAKEWLTRAEQSFAKESDLRGELDLFLARAELEQAKKVSQARKSASKHPALLEQGLAVTIALAIFTFGFGASYLMDNRLTQVEPFVMLGQSKIVPSNFLAPNIYPGSLQKESFSGANNLAQKPTDKMVSKMVSLEVNTLAPDFSLNNSSLRENPGNKPQIENSPAPATKVSAEPLEPFEKQNSVLSPEPELKQDTKISAQPIQVSNEEMKKLINTAGKSLRSQEQ